MICRWSSAYSSAAFLASSVGTDEWAQALPSGLLVAQ